MFEDDFIDGDIALKTRDVMAFEMMSQPVGFMISVAG